MKLLFLCKRRPQGKDLIKRPYGRFYYLPRILAEKGHEVHILLLSYKNEPNISENIDGISWTSISLINQGPLAYIREAKKIIQEIKPDWIAGFSDTYYGILAQKLGTKYNINSLVDAYDNYESYIPWLKPLHHLWQHSLSRATLVTAAGPSLIDLLGKSRPGKPTEIIPMAADPIFQPMDKIECRKKLGLPVDKKLIGYSGSTIHASRGIDILFRAFDSLKQEVPDIELVLTGRRGRNVTIPSEANWLGYIPDADIPLLLNSLDVLLVINKPSSFGNYSYPVKLYEAMKCQIPVVVSETLSTKWIMRQKPELLVKPGNVEELCNKIKSVLLSERIEYDEQPDWKQIGSEFEILLKENFGQIL
jgi:glycosyltransferase involved in cell wall biosynthesis